MDIKVLGPGCAKCDTVAKHVKSNTIVLVTHESHVAAHAARTIRLLDGEIESDTRRAPA